MSDQEIDEIFGLGLGDSSLPFDESAWAGAEKAIIADERKRRRRAIFLWFTGALLLLSGGLGYYSYQQNSAMAEEIEVQEIQESPSPLNNAPVLSDTPEAKEESENSEDSDSFKEDPVRESFDEERENLNLPMSSLRDKPFVAIIDEKEEQQIEDQVPQETDAIENANFLSLSLLDPREANEIDNTFNQSINGDFAEPSEIPYKMHWNKKLNIVAGTNPSLATMEISDSEYGDVPYYLGLTFSKIHNYSLEYGIGIVYEQILYSDNRKEIVQESFGFGREVKTHEIEKIKGNYISIPIYLKYRIFRKHHLMAGMQYSQLLQTNSSYSLRGENNAGQISTLSDTDNVSGFQDDLNRSQFVGIIGYDFAFSDRLRLQAIARIGANSLYNDSGNVFNNDDRIHFKLGIEYSLWRY